MIKVTTALIVFSVVLNVELSLYILCPKFKEWVDKIFTEDE